MCGIAGFLDPKNLMTYEALSRVASAMTGAIRHRGPDDGGLWIDEKAGVVLGHRRLSILDLTAEGHQPMVSANGRYVIVFNGEIYNYAELRAQIEQFGVAPAWRGHSDTEVLLAAICYWGVEEALKRLTGMFAFALWDRYERALYLARDRIGEKPLYYGWAGDVFLFGSELKALRAHPAWRGEVDRDVLALYMRYSYVPSPYCVYKDIRKLNPATFLRMANPAGKEMGSTQQYWSARQVAESGLRTPFAGDEREAIAQLDSLLRGVIGRQMVADVPLGAFLSGGVDSSTVVALMQAQSRRPVKTFTIGFTEADYDEAVHARAVAAHLGTDHTELQLAPRQALEVIPALPTFYDEPFSDSSQIPTYLVSKLAREHVSVSLSGDGGDELFGGYYRYHLGKDIWDKVGRLPKPVRRLIAASIRCMSPDGWNRGFAYARPMIPRRMSFANPGDKLHKLAEVMDAKNFVGMYGGLVSQWKDTASLVPGSSEPQTLLSDSRCWVDTDEAALQMMFLDLISYLPDDILVKLDRASMAVSLESRVPFLDHEVVAFSWRLPLSMKVRDGQGKWLLRQVAYQYVPRGMIDRPKSGFGIPIEHWLRGPLREWAEDLLDPVRMRNDGFLDPGVVRKKWDEHLSGARNWQHHLWSVLMFNAWLDMSASPINKQSVFA